MHRRGAYAAVDANARSRFQNVREIDEMARPTNKPRVPTLDPHQVALDFTRSCVQHWMGITALLHPACAAAAPDEDALTTTRLYRQLRKLADYAVNGIKPAASIDALVAPLQELAASPLWERIGLDEVVSAVDPEVEEHAVKLILAAASARDSIDASKVVTSTQVAILAGVTRAAIRAAIGRSELTAENRDAPGKGGAYVIDAAEAAQWLHARGIPGFTPSRRRPPRTMRRRQPA